jgi:hypothetical protein
VVSDLWSGGEKMGKVGEVGEQKRKLLCKVYSAMDSDSLESESTNFILIYDLSPEHFVLTMLVTCL